VQRRARTAIATAFDDHVADDDRGQMDIRRRLPPWDNASILVKGHGPSSPHRHARRSVRIGILTTRLVYAKQTYRELLVTTFVISSHALTVTAQPCTPSAWTLAERHPPVSAPSFKERLTLFRWFHTRSLPIPHAPVGDN
jgi:hypothetical protein